MKANLHPAWHHDAVVSCACGNKFITGSTRKTLQVDICDQCHPFFTGEMKFVDRQGRVDKFKKKMQSAQARKKAAQAKQKKKSRQTDKPVEKVKSYREILREQQAQLRKQAAN